MKSQEVLKRNNLLVAFLSAHRGGENIVSSKEIGEYLSECGYNTQVGHVHQIIRDVMRERMLPICSLNSKGYFWAESQEELKTAIADLQGRVCEIQARIDLLNKFIVQ